MFFKILVQGCIITAFYLTYTSMETEEVHLSDHKVHTNLKRKLKEGKIQYS